MNTQVCLRRTQQKAGWQSVVHPDDLQRHIEKWRVCSVTGEPVRRRGAFPPRGGRGISLVLVGAVPLRDAAGKILKWYGVLTDIEDRKRTEALIAGEKRVLELVAKGEALPDILDSLCRMVEGKPAALWPRSYWWKEIG